MRTDEMIKAIRQPEYDFLCSRPELGDNIVMIAVGGSHAYGTNVDGSDLDIRGIATNTFDRILIGNPFEQSVDVSTDTTIYSFDKIINLLCNCNPNIIEILGLKPEHYLYINSVGKLLLENSGLFLSKRAINSFGGYANSQLRRLENKASKSASQEREEQFILRSIECAQIDFKRRYGSQNTLASADAPIEGYVVRDADGFMVKMKTDYYTTWKSLRTVADKVYNYGYIKYTSSLRTPMMNYFYAFVKEYYAANKGHQDIITLRKLYEQSRYVVGDDTNEVIGA